MQKSPEKVELDSVITEERFEEILKKFELQILADGDCTHKSSVQYLRDVRMFRDWNTHHNNNKPWNLIDHVDFDDYKTFVRFGRIEDKVELIKKVTLSRKLAALRKFFAFLKAKRLIAVDPMTEVKSPTLEERRIISTISDEDIERILNVNLGAVVGRKNPDEPKDRLNTLLVLRNKAIFHMFAASGIRVSELCDLKLDDVDCVTPCITVTAGKGNKPRKVDITKECVRALQDYLAVRPRNHGSWLFLSEQDKQMTRFAIYRLCKQLKAHLGIEKPLSPHKFRHWIASALMKSNNMPIEHVQKFLGHSKPTTTSLYLHSDSKERKETYDRSHPRANK